METNLEQNSTIDPGTFLDESVELHIQALRAQHSEEIKAIRAELELLQTTVNRQREIITSMLGRLQKGTNTELNRIHRKMMKLGTQG